MDDREKYINEFQNSIKAMEDVTDYVLKELKKVGDNNLGVILNIANDVKSLIEYEKYEEALDMIFIEKTNDNKKIEEKKNFLNEILKKKPELDKKIKELSKQYKVIYFKINF